MKTDIHAHTRRAYLIIKAETQKNIFGVKIFLEPVNLYIPGAELYSATHREKRRSPELMSAVSREQMIWLRVQIEMRKIRSVCLTTKPRLQEYTITAGHAN